jgi:lysophospholipase L1-like esterase
MFSRRTCAAPFILATALLTFSSALAQTPVRIMPLGDSITYGSGGTGGGYRVYLYTALTNAGYTVDYVGTVTGNPAAGLGAEIQHEGHGGWRITNPSNGLYDYIHGWFESIDDPHVILLHIGTNDSGGFNANTNDVNNLDRLITRMALCQPSAQIIVTSLMKRGEPNYTYITNYFNPYVPGKVAGQQALGRRVTFLDMHAYVELSDMPDSLHPNDGGYAKMAAAWLPAITNVIGSSPAANQPAPIRAAGSTNVTAVTITFNKRLSYATATNPANYAVSGGVTVLGAALDAAQRTVTLTTSAQTRGTTYTVTMNDLEDETSPTALAIPADSQVTFTTLTPRGYANNVPEATDYRLVYTFDIPTTAGYLNTPPAYAADNSALTPAFDRVAYYMELQGSSGDLQYVWVSMDAFTNRADKLGLPTRASGALYQQYVTNLHVYCNVAGVNTGLIARGNLEFWPYNYSAGNAKGIPGASGTLYDFGDQCSFSDTYACMQVHNTAAGQTLFALNNWGSSGTPTLDLGIGNNPGAHPDWTFSGSAGGYTVRRLQVLVRLDANDTTPPAILSAQAGVAGNLVQVVFNEQLAASSVDGGRFSLNSGVSVVSATLLSDLRTVNVFTSPQPGGVPLTLTVDGVRDVSGNAVSASVAVSAPALPPEVTADAGALASGYQLIYSLDIPVLGNFNATAGPYRFNQSGYTGIFDRVAYYLELQPSSGSRQYLWASMDAFTMDARKIGVPTFASGAIFQRFVSNLDVKSNVAGITNGTGMAGGNLEFWPHNYSEANGAGVPGASASLFDFGDTRSSSGNHGSMQIHSATNKQTLISMNNWGADGQAISIGIGNCPSPVSGGLDWTHSNNSANYSRRTLHVLVRPASSSASVPPVVAANVPSANAYQLAYTINLPVNGSFNTNSPAYYAVNNYTNGLATSFSRIAYYLELQSGSNPTQWVWTAMDAFTTDARKIGVPTNSCYFQQKVTRLEVLSNVGGIVNGSSIDTGNVEIWPSSYNGSNAINIPNASGTYYDFGDGNANGTSTGYGSMQVHNHGSTATQTLFAVNNFNNNAALCVGIGNRPGSNDKDWTFAGNAGSYNYRRLHVFVLPGGDGDFTRPTLTRASASRTLSQIVVTFSEALADDAGSASFYSIDGGASVTAARLLPGKNEVLLTTTALTPGATYAVSVTGVRDRSYMANAILPGSTTYARVPTLALPDVLTNVTEAAGYELIHQLPISNAVYWANGATYTVDESKCARTTSFDRVAYCLEVVTNGVYKWVYVSMDAFTPDITKIGVPTADRAALFQQYVSNLNVYASENVANVSVTTGVGIVAGNIEFWPSNYGQNNDKGIPGALGTVLGTNYFDFGDGGSPNATTAGHGSMQVHNYLKGHTIFAINSFGSNNRTPAMGIGNNTFHTGANVDPDWTFYYNAPQYTTKNLYVLARPGPSLASAGSGPEIWRQPQSKNVRFGRAVTLSVYAPAATAYQWRKNGMLLPGATQSWLEIAPAQLADAAVYDVLVYSSSAAYTVSAPAAVNVYLTGTRIMLY